MAIIQISKIQQRSGNLVDLPQLSEAQLGWANDANVFLLVAPVMLILTMKILKY
jgi:hypothetical protein